MDELRAAATGLAGWAAGSRPARMLASWLTRDRESGQGLAEYALILGLIAIVAIAALVFLGETIAELFWDPISDEFGNVLCNNIGICPPPP